MKDEQKFIDTAQEKLRQREKELPVEVSDSLSAARREAIAAMESAQQQKYRWFAPNWMLPAGGIAVIVLAVTLFIPSGPVTLPVLDEIEMFAAAEIEMLDEIEMLAWILEQDENANL